MSDHGAPWWAEVQHLRPREDRAAEPVRRFRRGGGDAPEQDASVATLEHEVPGLAAEDAAWLETLGTGSAPQDLEVARPTTEDFAALTREDEPAWDDEPAPARSTLWDPALEEAFARTPSWAEEDDERLLPKGANRIENGRRTIEIRGQVDRVVGFTPPADTTVATRSGRRRPSRTPAERLAGRPDRLAMWAFLLGLLLIAIAAFTAPDAGAAVLY